MDTLQKNNYDLAKAMSTLVPQGGPVLCRDEMEEWSASEAMLFEEALEKYGKDFNDIRQDFVSSALMLHSETQKSNMLTNQFFFLGLQLPWKSLASVVQFYYMWKTTDRYIQQVCLQPITQQEEHLKFLNQAWIQMFANHTCFCFLSQKRLKAAEADSKLKQVYIPT